MTSKKKHTTEEVKASLRQFANSQRDIADEAARMFDGCDDPMHPWRFADENGKQYFRDWHDFTDRVCRVIVEADGDDWSKEVQDAMALYRKQNPYGICVSLVMALNKIHELEAKIEIEKPRLEKPRAQK